MALEISIGWKLGILFIIIIILYFLLKYLFDVDVLEEIAESISGIEFNMTALILTFLFSGVIWAIIWINPLWVNSTAFGPGSKIFLTIALPIVGYPLAIRSLNKY